MVSKIRERNENVQRQKQSGGVSGAGGALEGCVCVCLCQGETMANVVVNLFYAKFKNIFTSPCSYPAPSPRPLPLPALDFDANNDIYIFYLPT